LAFSLQSADLLAQQATQDVKCAAWRVGHDNLNCLRRLGPCIVVGKRDEEDGNKGSGESQKLAPDVHNVRP